MLVVNAGRNAALGHLKMMPPKLKFIAQEQ